MPRPAALIVKCVGTLLTRDIAVLEATANIKLLKLCTLVWILPDKVVDVNKRL